MSNRKKRSDATGRTKPAVARSPNERLEPSRAPSRPYGLQAREPSRFVSGVVRLVSGMLTLVLVVMMFLGGAGVVLYNQYERAGPLEAARTVVIPKGKGRIDIAQYLEEQGVIANRWTFVASHMMQAWMSGKRGGDLKAGEYELKQNASMREVIDVLTEGKSIQYKVAMPEGLTSQQMIERLKSDSNLSGELTSVPPEGSLLPDTYLVAKGTSREDLVERMQSSMKTYLAEQWEKRAPELPLRTIEEALTFASIVEKETGQADERGLVSSVFHNRLKKGMRLQSDPTIIYGIVGGQGTLGRAITKADIDGKTPYNTYQINGLPPGPICNPGRAAIEAALNPATSTAVYFVANGTGGHTFSETLKEHNSAVQKYREFEKQRPRTENSSAATLEPDPDVAPIPTSSDGAPAKGKSTTGGTAAAGAAAVPLPQRKPKKPQN